jgi:hypothetical protein
MSLVCSCCGKEIHVERVEVMPEGKWHIVTNNEGVCHVWCHEEGRKDLEKMEGNG